MRFVKLNRKNFLKMVKISRICFGNSYVDDQVVLWFNKRLDGTYKDSTRVLEYFLVIDKKPIGITGFFQTIGENKFWLGYLGVVPDKRRNGIGTSILEKTMKLAKRHGANIFCVYGDSKRAEKFYRANGFGRMKRPKNIIVGGNLVYRYPPGTYFYSKKI